MKFQLEQLWTVDDVAKYCRVKPSVVRCWVRDSDLPHSRLGKYLRFSPEDVREWVDGRKHSSVNRLAAEGLRRIGPE